MKEAFRVGMDNGLDERSAECSVSVPSINQNKKQLILNGGSRKP
jgi:hypothetical protein